MNQPIDVVHTNGTGKFILSFYYQVQHKSDCTTHQMMSALKLRIKEVNKFYYPCSKSIGADLLHDYCAADLRFNKIHDPVLTKINNSSNPCVFLRQKACLFFLTCGFSAFQVFENTYEEKSTSIYCLQFLCNLTSLSLVTQNLQKQSF